MAAGLAGAGEMRELVERAQASGAIGIDTEFMGEGRYRTLLCVVQVAVVDPEGTHAIVLDALGDAADLEPLRDALADQRVEVVMHAGRQDVALLRRFLATEVHSLFDTQVAAGFAGLTAQAGYETLLRELLGVRLRKSASYTRWNARPLSEEQVEYAREDVLHLLQLADELRRRLAESGRLQWAREECRPLETSNDDRDVETVFARLPRINSLTPAARAIAHELVEWREDLAERQDRPVSSVLNDSALIEVARRRPSSRAELEQVRGLNPSHLRRGGDELLLAVQRGRDRAPIPAEESHREHGAPQDGPLIALGEALVRARALEAGLAYELVAARADLGQIVASVRTRRPEPDVRTLRGWRRELVGAELLELLAGRCALRVGPQRLLEVRSEAAPAPLPPAAGHPR